MTEISVPAESSVTIVPKTEASNKKQYLFPYWSNKNNRHLIVTIKYPNGKESISSIMDKDGTNPDMIEILKQYTEDDIDKNTEEGLRRRNENIKRQMERRESQKARAKQEALFNAKLQAFEIDMIKNSKDVELKRKIRKSKNIMEVQAYATILLMKDLENGEEGK